MAKTELIAHYDTLSPISEGYRAIRINLQFAGADKTLQVVGVTSSSPGEGKSTTIANLAIVMAQDNKKVLLIDCDLRKPTQHKKFEIEQDGLTNTLVRGKALDALVQHDVFPNLDILTSGPIPPNPSELLGSHKMAEVIAWARDHYDYVLIDLPPILAVADAAVIGNMVDGVLMVVASGSMTPNEAMDAKKRLQQAGVSILGVILNKMPQQRRYGYYQYYYHDDDKL
ncbi:CpsD/CapB family tyrosine-protein kinase [Veillonella magna]|uniref:CpsD/CapB family tyrosine-protein kinase n=1 Tax=Veillonella magna TaxID=464322 RepID=UPI0023F187ED|nr:CpsD/CapB family tyrosine-protein kinase [Veillonella magna]MBD8976835.1 polysaccharide biosynthesis tyrosine autokinase [Veillonella magna]